MGGYSGGDKIAAVGYLGRAIPLFRSLGDAQSLSSSLAMHALQSLPWSSETTISPLGPHEAAVQGAAEALQLARQIESPAAQAFAGNALSNAFLARGEFGPSIDHAREARRVATEIGHRQWMVAATFVLGRSYVMLHAPAQAVAVAADGASVVVENGVVKFYFASGKAELAAGAKEALGGVVKGVQAGQRAVVSGFHDTTGDPAKNEELAKQRALAVRDALVAEGIAEGQIELKKPENATGSGPAALARRVEVALQ